MMTVHFEALREPKQLGPYKPSERVRDNVLEGVRDAGAAINHYYINKEQFEEYYKAGGYQDEFAEYYAWNQLQKSMEHYVVADLLKLSEEDIYIDIANQYSPTPTIYNRLFGCKTYKQDLDFPDGFHGDTIGGDAANMDLPDEFCTKMGLHCSFEHFEGESDMGFIREAYRVLKPGGSVAFAPLYISEQYYILTAPQISAVENVEFEQGVLLCCVESYNNRHGRFYSPAKLKERVIEQAPFEVDFYRIENSKEIKPDSYLAYALKLTKPL